MTRPRRMAAVAIVLLVAGWAFADGPAAPALAGKNAPPVPVEISRPDGTKVRGTFGPPSVSLWTDNLDPGTIPVSRLKKLEMGRADGGVTATATLTDDDHLTGELKADVLPVTLDGRAEALKPVDDVVEIKFLHERAWSWGGAILGLVTLAIMEIVLGVDNIIVLAIVSGKLPKEQQAKARRLGLIAALATRLGLLFTLSWLLGLTRPLFHIPDNPILHSPEARAVSLRDIILAAGGLFLIRKSVKEMHEKVEEKKAHAAGTAPAKKLGRFWPTIFEIAMIDILFSLDSVITAVGMVDELWVMVGGMLIAVGVMMLAAGPIARFVDKHPTITVLALSFLILIGVMLVAESLGQHINKGYIYFAMAFGVAVEVINLRMRGADSAAHPEPASVS